MSTFKPLLDELINHIVALEKAPDVKVKQPTQPVSLPPLLGSVQTVLAGLTQKVLTDATRLYPPQQSAISPEGTAPEQPAAPVHVPTYFQSFVAAVEQVVMPPLPPLPVATEWALPAPDLTPPEATLHRILVAEAQDFSQNMNAYGATAATSLQKLRKAVQAIGARRHGDALTLLRTTWKSDINNRTLSYCISQLQYFRAFNGAQGVLPEARDMATHASQFNDRGNIAQYKRYSYIGAVTELPLAPARTLQVLLGQNTLNVEPLLNDGLAADNGHYLRGWFMLSLIPPEHWKPDTYETLSHLVRNVPGGAVLYLYLFRPRFAELLQNPNTMPPALAAVEADLATHYTLFTSISNDLKTKFSDNLTPSWTVSQRYLSAFTTGVPLPTWEEVLANTSLSGTRFLKNSAPGNSLASRGLTSTHYWQTWGLALAPDEKQRQNTLPTQDALRELPFLTSAGNFILAVEKEEQGIDKTAWQTVHTLLPTYSISQLAGAGVSMSRYTMGTISLRPPLDFYKAEWAKAVGKHPLYSHVLRNAAQQGAFGSVQEILAAYQAIARNMADVNTNPARLTVALLEHIKAEERRKRYEEMKKSLPARLSMVFIPALLATLFVFFSSESVLSGLSNTALVWLLAGGACVVVILTQEQEAKKASTEDGPHCPVPTQPKNPVAYRRK